MSKNTLNCLTDCNSACCHHIEFDFLTPEQLEGLLKAGAQMEGMAIIGHCPWLSENRCKIYNDKTLRPPACFSSFEPGSLLCGIFRDREGY